MTADPSKKEKTKGLSDQIHELAQRVDDLEETLRRMTDPLSQATRLIERYIRLVTFILGSGTGASDILFPEIRDPIEREIMFILLRMRYGNISQITQELRRARGKASRSVVRKKLISLLNRGFIIFDEGVRGYSYSEKTRARVLSLLAFTDEGGASGDL